MSNRPLKTLRLENLQKINMGNRRTLELQVDFTHLDEDFKGTFIMRYPSQMENIEIGVLRAELLGGQQSVDTETDNIVTAISTLEVILDKFPEWFNPYDPKIEYEILAHLYIEHAKWVQSFRRSRKQGNEGDSGDQSS